MLKISKYKKIQDIPVLYASNFEELIKGKIQIYDVDKSVKKIISKGERPSPMVFGSLLRVTTLLTKHIVTLKQENKELKSEIKRLKKK